MHDENFTFNINIIFNAAFYLMQERTKPGRCSF